MFSKLLQTASIVIKQPKY